VRPCFCTRMTHAEVSLGVLERGGLIHRERRYGRSGRLADRIILGPDPSAPVGGADPSAPPQGSVSAPLEGSASAPSSGAGGTALEPPRNQEASDGGSRANPDPRLAALIDETGRSG
jgi:hypothetical protein